MPTAYSAARRLVPWLCALACCAAQARRHTDTGTDPSLVIDKLHQSYVIAADGSYTLIVDEVRTIARASALGPHSAPPIALHATLDTLEQIEAYTEKPDGRRIAVEAAAIREQPVAADAPQFVRIMTVAFPEVAVGDRLALHYVVKRARALFPGQFEDLSSSRFYRHKNYRVSYDLPANLPLYADAAGFRKVPARAAPGRARHDWVYQPGDNARIEAGAVSYLDYGKRLAVSTFADYGAFARAFEAVAAGKARATPDIAALARQLTADLPDARARALALGDWVRRHVAYVSVPVGLGAVAPHAAAEVLRQRQGDCQDHAVLLEALLAAVGIDSGGALLNNANAFRLPTIPTLGILNHMVLYIPGLDLYLDPSAAVAAGYLPDYALGKPALLLKTGAIRSTPPFQHEHNRNKLHFEVAASGASLFRVVKTSTGALAEPYRQALRATTQAERDRFVGRILRGIGQSGYGVLDPGLVDGTGEAYQMVFAGISENFAAVPGPAGIATSYDFWGGIGSAVDALAQERRRRQPFACPAIDRDDKTGFRFAPGLRIVKLPANMALRGAGFDYRADYQRHGNSVTVRRHLTFAPGGALCSPGDFARMAPLLTRMRRDLGSRIVLQTR